MNDRPRTPLEMLQAMLRGEVPPPPVGRLLGLELIQAESGRCVFRLPVDERFANPMGTLHGGIVCDIADAALGTAFATTLRAGESYTTVELAINFLRPVWKATLTATGRLVKRSRRFGLTECEVVDEKGGLVAWAKSTCYVLEAGAAEGR